MIVSDLFFLHLLLLFPIFLIMIIDDTHGKVLVFDDALENLSLLQAILTENRYQVHVADAGKDAILVAKELVPDLILLDTSLPDLNGFNLCAQIKSDHTMQDIPVIFIVGSGSTCDMLEGFRVGGADYITRPFQAAEVLTRIRTHLTLRRMRAQIEQQQSLLQTSEISYRNLFENMLDGVALHEIIYDDQDKAVNYVVLSVNPAFLRHTGLKPEDVTGKLVTDAFDTEVPPYLDIYVQTAESGKPSAFETYFEPLGKHFKISVSSPAKKHFVTVFEDITERIKSEEALRVSLAMYKLLFNSFPIGLTISDSDGKIVESNKIAEGLLGISREEQEKRTISGIEWRIVQPDGTPMQGSEFPSVRALKEKCQVNNVEMGIVKGENQITWINVSAAPIPLEGFGVVITYNDISDRKHAEDALRESNAYLENLINYANSPIIVWDPTFRITRFNHAFEYLTGRSEAEVVGKSLEILFPSSLVNESMALIHKTLSGERWETKEIKILHLDGSVRTVLWNSATLFAQDGVTPIATIAQGKDITSRKLAETELSLKNEELARTIAEKDKFFSIIAHDLRSPFSTFMGFTQLMAEELPTLTLDEIQNIAVKMRKSASNLHEMLENLLEWSCMQRGITSFDPSVFMLKNKIAESLKLVSDAALQKNITIRLEILDDVKIFSDPNMFDTIIRNLASNAIKFTPKGGAVTISSRRTKDNLVEVAVKDTGIGMSEDIRSNLFHIDKNTNRKGTQGELSTGLGLILCKDFIEKQGGKIWMKSEEGKGSTFYFTTPGVDGSSEKN